MNRTEGHLLANFKAGLQDLGTADARAVGVCAALVFAVMVMAEAAVQMAGGGGARPSRGSRSG